MRLPIEEWLQDAEIPAESKVALQEAVTCFKGGGVRAVLLFSYLGWSLAIRSRILASQRPAGLTDVRWKHILDDLRNEDKWDAKVFDCIQMHAPVQLFQVSENVRTQVRYWKDRRNDCAHFKFNEISVSHVEALWSFLKSNLGRFVPFGSEEDLRQRFVRHFDPNFTPPKSDVGPIVARISTSVEVSRYGAFLESLVELSRRDSTGKIALNGDEVAVIFTGLLKSGDNAVVTAAVSVSERIATLAAAIVRQSPPSCLLFAKNAPLIRQIWRTLSFSLGRQDLPVFAALARNDLIPAEERREAAEWTVRHMNGDVPANSDLPALTDIGFIEAFKRIAFDERQVNDFGWANRNAESIRWYLEAYPISEDVAQVICEVFVGPPYPYKARSAIREMIKNSKQKRQELATLASKNGLSIPADLETAEDVE